MKKQFYYAVLEEIRSALRDHGADEAVKFLKEKIGQFQDVSGETGISLKSDKLPVPPEVLKRTNCVAVFSDGACRGNPGPGSWASVAQNNRGEILFASSGVDVMTTNNKMELQGAIEGLTQLMISSEENGQNLKDISICLYSDSKYVIEGMKSWIIGWKARGWKKADKKTPENVELWKLLDEKTTHFQMVEFIWVKGHDGHPQNEYCDQLANKALDDAGF